MTTTTQNPETSPSLVAESLFLQELVRQIRAFDHYGFYRSWSDELVLSPFVIAKKKRREISLEGDVDPTTKMRILCFYRAIASLIENETGQLCQVVVDINHEGFGWVLIWCGRLMVVSRTLRDAHRFGFETMESLAEQGKNLTASGVEMVKRFPEVAQF
jgi:probable nitrogen fixation protein